MVLKLWKVEAFTDAEIEKFAEEEVSKFLPEGQVILCHAGPSYESLVDIATGKELDRWETR